MKNRKLTEQDIKYAENYLKKNEIPKETELERKFERAVDNVKEGKIKEWNKIPKGFDEYLDDDETMVIALKKSIYDKRVQLRKEAFAEYDDDRFDSFNELKEKIEKIDSGGFD